MQLSFIGWAFVIVVGVLPADAVLHVILPHLIGRNSLGTPGRCRLLSLIAAIPSLSGERGKVFAGLPLLRMLNHLGRAEEAHRLGERLLGLKLPVIFESEVRFRVADSLETLGRADEARLLRDQARASLEGGPPDAASRLLSGQLKEAQGDLPGALEDYSKAVQFAGPAESETKAKALLKLALAEFHSGKVDDAATHAAMAAELAKNPQVRFFALRGASLCFATQGDLEQSDHYGRLACDLGRERGDPQELAKVLAHLAENLIKRGRLAEAFEAVEEARRIKDVRECHTILYEIHRSAGRFEQALEELETAARTGAFGLGRYEVKMQALYDFGASRLLVDLNRIDEASVRLERSIRALSGDPKNALWCKAAAGRIAALRGERENAHALMAEVADGQATFAQDRQTQQLCLTLRARSCQALGEFEQASEAWEQYLAASPNAVDQPGVLYNLGECRLGQGDHAAAIDFFQRAGALGLETHESNLARRRLAELGG